MVNFFSSVEFLFFLMLAAADGEAVLGIAWSDRG